MLQALAPDCIDCQAKLNGSTPRALEQQLGFGGATTMLLRLITPGSKTIPMVMRILSEARTRTHLVFTIWSATSGNGPRIVTLTATAKRRQTGAQPKSRATACESIAAARGCIRAGSSAQRPVKEIPPTFATSSWDSGLRGRCREMKAYV